MSIDQQSDRNERLVCGYMGDNQRCTRKRPTWYEQSDLLSRSSPGIYTAPFRLVLFRRSRA